MASVSYVHHTRKALSAHLSLVQGYPESDSIKAVLARGAGSGSTLNCLFLSFLCSVLFSLVFYRQLP